MKTISCLQTMAGLLLIISSISIVGCEEQGRQARYSGPVRQTSIGEETTMGSSDHATQPWIARVGQSQAVVAETVAENDMGADPENQAERTSGNGNDSASVPNGYEYSDYLRITGREDVHTPPEMRVRLQQDRNAIFHMMGWTEGVYNSDTEYQLKQAVDNLAARIPDNSYGHIILKVADRNGWIRPLTDIAFDSTYKDEDRRNAINLLSMTKNPIVLPVFRILLHEPYSADVELRERAIEGLCRCGAKTESYEEMVKLNREGTPFIVGEIDEEGHYIEDRAIIPYLITISKIDSNDVKLGAAMALCGYGERALARKIALELKATIQPTGIPEDDSRSMMFYINRLLRETEGE